MTGTLNNASIQPTYALLGYISSTTWVYTRVKHQANAIRLQIKRCVETNMFNALIRETINGIGVISNVEVKHEYWRCREANWTVIKVDSFV